MCTWVVAKTPNSAAARPRASATSTSTTTALPGIPDGAASSVMETVSKAPRRRRRSPAAAAARTRSRTVAARARSGPTAASTAARRVRAQPRIVTWYTRIRTSSAVSRRSTASWRASSDGNAEGSWRSCRHDVEERGPAAVPRSRRPCRLSAPAPPPLRAGDRAGEGGGVCGGGGGARRAGAARQGSREGGKEGEQRRGGRGGIKQELDAAIAAITEEARRYGRN